MKTLKPISRFHNSDVSLGVDEDPPMNGSHNYDTTRLFKPLRIKNKELKNRIVMPPLSSCMGITSDAGINWYARHAKGGCGLVIVESTVASLFGTAFTPDNLTPLVEAIHKNGALAAIQIFPGFVRKHEAPEDLSKTKIEEMFAAFRIAAKIASHVGTAFRPDNLRLLVEAIHKNGALGVIQLFRRFARKHEAPEDLSKTEIEEIITAYRTATRIAARAGFDGVEPHGAYGHILNQFFSPVQNKRRDDYGGSIENRMRMALRVVEAAKSNLDPEMLLLYRHSPAGNGYDVDESLLFAERLISAGVDVLDLAPSSIDAPGDMAAPFKKLKVPVIAAHGLDRIEKALEVVDHDRADLVAIGHGLIADPEWPNKVKEGRFAEIVQCKKCDEKCYGHLKKRIPIACAQWK